MLSQLVHEVLGALRSVRRTPGLSLLIVLAIAVGIGSSMTVQKLLSGMSSDPIPSKSSRLFTVQIDNFGPDNRDGGEPPVLLSVRDAMALVDARQATREAAMYEISMNVRPEEASIRPFIQPGRATSADFFPMFDVPFVAGAPWSRADDEARADVAVLTAPLAARVFGSAREAIGRTLRLEGRDYRIVGVTADWRPRPRFYDVGGARSGGGFGASAQVFVPVTTALERQVALRGSRTCVRVPPPGHEAMLASECVWMQFWAELPSAADRGRYLRFVSGYAAEQQRAGRFSWDPIVRLHDVREWLVYRQLVPDELRVAAAVGFAFLFVCLLNAVGLMLARSARAQAELGLRRALGASRRRLLAQGLTEALLFGLAGGLLGFGLTLIGLRTERSLLPPELASLTDVDIPLLVRTMSISLAATALAGVYPAWRASRGAGRPRPAARRGHLAGSVLVGVQIALTLAIVSNALLLASEHVQRTHRPSGVDETDLMVITSVSNAPPSELRARAEADLAALRGTPGIVDAFATNSYPLAQAGSQIWIDRRPLADHDLQQRPRSAQYFVDEHALATYGLRLVSGRWFRPEEVGDQGDPALVPVVVITRALAQRLFPEGSALGATVYTRGDVPQTVVGIVERMQTPWPNPGANSAIVEQSTLFPYRLADAAMIYLVRAKSGGLSAAMASAEQRLRELDPERVIANQRTFAEVRSDVYRSSRALSGILGAVSVLLVIVTALGVVGLTAYWTSQRRQQIGVRRALGARRADILQRFQLETLLVAGGGLGAGSLLAVTLNLLLVGSIETTRMSSGQLVAGVLTVLVIVQLAALWPSLRAASVPPALATRAG